MSITKEVLRGGLGLGGIRILSYGLQFGIQILLARMLTPDVFGIVSLSSSLLLLFSLFGRWGIVEAFVSNPDREAIFSTIFWLRVAYALLILLILAPLAFVIGLIYDPIVVEVFLVMALAQVVSMVAVIFRALLQQQVTLVPIGIVGLIATICAGAVSIMLIFDGWEIWGLVSFYIIRQLIKATGFTVLSPRYPELRIHPETVRWFKSHASGMFLSKSLASVQTRGDDILIGTLDGTAVLGIYSVAWRLVNAFKSATQQTINAAMRPLFGTLQDDAKRSQRSFEFLIRTQLLTTTPLFLGLSIIAPEFVPFIFGEQWRDSIPVVQVLSIAGVLFPIDATCKNFYYSRGNSATVLRVQIAYIIALLCVMPVLVLSYGAVGAALAVNTMLVVSLGLYGWYLWRDIKINLLYLFIPVIVAALIGATTGLALRRTGLFFPGENLLHSVVVSSLSVVIFTSCISVLQYDTIRSDISTVRGLLFETSD